MQIVSKIIGEAVAILALDKCEPLQLCNKFFTHGREHINQHTVNTS